MTEIIFEDNHLLVVKKPVNIPVMEDSSKDDDLLSMMKVYIKEKYSKPGNVFLGLVHRLDRPVGGVMVFAKTSKSASRLSEQIRNNLFQKSYLCVVRGKLNDKNGELKNYLSKNESENKSYVTEHQSPNSKLALLTYEVMKESELYSLIKVNLITGRHHQIRVQFANAGFPIYGDQKYGTDQQKAQIALWAFELTLSHPVTKEKMTFTCDPDYDRFPWSLFI
ncbi:MAG: RluA family pseudouridine synthase [Clostridia bacterium]|nr:RluA family pseudouridine synthase [Clostridia bacterium]